MRRSGRRYYRFSPLPLFHRTAGIFAASSSAIYDDHLTTWHPSPGSDPTRLSETRLGTAGCSDQSASRSCIDISLTRCRFSEAANHFNVPRCGPKDFGTRRAQCSPTGLKPTGPPPDGASLSYPTIPSQPAIRAVRALSFQTWRIYSNLFLTS